MRRWTLLLPLLALSACSSGRQAAQSAPPDPAPYIEVRGTNVIELRIAARRFVPARGKGPTIWLTGASHVGDSNYYAALQKHLAAQTLVLFEGVGEHAHQADAARTNGNAAKTNSTSDAEHAVATTNRPGLQSSLASSLGLQFQLEAIDYSRPNFKNSDLSIAELRELMADQGSVSNRTGGSTSAARSFDTLLQMMEGGSFLNSLLRFGLSFLAASPKMQATAKLALIDTLGQIKGDLAQARGVPPEMRQLLEVLIQKRNEKVIADLKSNLKTVGRHGSISVFFGTGHMPDLENRLRELQYRPAGDLWFTVFSVDLKKAGISPSEREFMRGMIEKQMKQFQSPAR